MAIEKVQLFSIPVSDQDRARNFYVDVLGLELLADTRMGPDTRWLMVAPAGAQTAMTLVTWFPTMPPGSLKGIVLETGDLEGDVARFRERGVAIPEGIQDAPWGRYAQFDDPDGNGIVLQATAAQKTDP